VEKEGQFIDFVIQNYKITSRQLFEPLLNSKKNSWRYRRRKRASSTIQKGR